MNAHRQTFFKKTSHKIFGEVETWHGLVVSDREDSRAKTHLTTYKEFTSVGVGRERKYFQKNHSTENQLSSSWSNRIWITSSTNHPLITIIRKNKYLGYLDRFRHHGVSIVSTSVTSSLCSYISILLKFQVRKMELRGYQNEAVAYFSEKCDCC